MYKSYFKLTINNKNNLLSNLYNNLPGIDAGRLIHTSIMTSKLYISIDDCNDALIKILNEECSKIKNTTDYQNLCIYAEKNPLLDEDGSSTNVIDPDFEEEWTMNEYVRYYVSEKLEEELVPCSLELSWIIRATIHIVSDDPQFSEPNKSIH